MPNLASDHVVRAEFEGLAGSFHAYNLWVDAVDGSWSIQGDALLWWAKSENRPSNLEEWISRELAESLRTRFDSEAELGRMIGLIEDCIWEVLESLVKNSEG